MASRMISLVVAYSPASTAAFRTASCSPVTATLIFWMSGIIHLELTKAYPVESGYSFPLFSTSWLVGDQHRKPKAWSAILGGQGFDSSSAAFKSAARPTVAVT